MIKIYTDLYDSIRIGYSKPKFSKIIKDYSITQKTLKNLNNNDLEGENPENILKDYIKNNLVEIIDVRGLSSIQIPIYNYCYRKYRNLYDWIGFIDIDEYLFIENNQTIKNYF